MKAFPEIVFRSKKIAGRGQDRYDVHGPLTMHGVTKAVVLPVKIVRQDFAIVWNKMLEAAVFCSGMRSRSISTWRRSRRSSAGPSGLAH